MNDKIKPQHLARKAILYIRQSSAYQVTHNLESQIDSVKQDGRSCCLK
jgi:DNA invertase Pin-like site-specific DNA recombinase